MTLLDRIAERWPEVALIAAVGLFLGSFINRCVLRLALEKSVFWPLRRYCDNCLQPLPFRFSIPLLGGLCCWFRCRHCRARLPSRGPVIELLTSALLTALFINHVVWAGYFSLPDIGPMIPGSSVRLHYALFIYHGLLFCFLIAGTFIDLDYMIVPDSITVPGTIIGLVMGGLWWIEIHPVAIWMPLPNINDTFDARVWNDLWSRWIQEGSGLPGWLDRIRAAVEWHWRSGGNCIHWLGFFTGLAGAVIGAGVTWIIRAVLSWAFGREAMGFGDVILMAMIGSYLGWQASIMVLVVFAPISGIVVGLLGWIFTRRVEFAFVPHLSIGAIILVLTWRHVWHFAYFSVFQMVYYESGYAAIGVAVLLVLLVVVALFVQWTKGLLGRAFSRS